MDTLSPPRTGPAGSDAPQPVTLIAADGYRLAAMLRGADQAGPITVVAPATAVPARTYARFAEALVGAGRPVLTFDYRGQGASAPASLKGFPARFRDWGILDIPAAIAWAGATYPDRPLHWVGHSYGGFGAGLAFNNAAIDRLFAFASMSADVRFMPLGSRLKTWPQFFAGTLVARGLGYLPGGLVGREALPREAMLEWYRFCTTKGFVFGVADLPEVRHFATLRMPVRLAYATDDGWISRAGCAHLLERISSHSDRTLWEIDPARDAAGAPLGHIGFFRAQHAATLWPKAIAWLDGAG